MVKVQIIYRDENKKQRTLSSVNLPSPENTSDLLIMSGRVINAVHHVAIRIQKEIEDAGSLHSI